LINIDDGPSDRRSFELTPEEIDRDYLDEQIFADEMAKNERNRNFSV